MVCMGSGDCVRIAPAAFHLDDEEIAIVTNAGAVDADTLRKAERSCPSGALVIHETEDT